MTDSEKNQLEEHRKRLAEHWRLLRMRDVGQ